MATFKEIAIRKFESYNFPTKIQTIGEWLEQQGLEPQENCGIISGSTRVFYTPNDTTQAWALEIEYPLDFVVIASPFRLEIHKEGFYPAISNPEQNREEFDIEVISLTNEIEDIKAQITESFFNLISSYNP